MGIAAFLPRAPHRRSSRRMRASRLRRRVRARTSGRAVRDASRVRNVISIPASAC
ncbi:hypothetical protein A7982_13508 [Minicystis rosea]|nr:hypothetical protein A7982_13508 [Minicystis rosea]